MRKLPARLRCLLALMLILLGLCGILSAPSVGLLAGVGTESFTFDRLVEHDWGTVISTSQAEIPLFRNERGLWLMNICLAGSLGAIFGGVHWYSAVRRSVRQQG
jgi:hypothetical protein